MNWQIVPRVCTLVLSSSLACRLSLIPIKFVAAHFIICQMKWSQTQTLPLINALCVTYFAQCATGRRNGPVLWVYRYESTSIKSYWVCNSRGGSFCGAICHDNHCCTTGWFSKTCTATDIHSWFVRAHGYLSNFWANLFNVHPQFFRVKS